MKRTFKNTPSLIFLDIDGVVCDLDYYNKRHFNPESVKVLNDILQVTNSTIVLSSAWRPIFSSIFDAQDFFKEEGVIRGPMGFTPFGAHDMGSVPFTYALDHDYIRACEILEWNSIHNREGRIPWIAIDDLNMYDTISRLRSNYTIPKYKFTEDNFVLTQNSIRDEGVKDEILHKFKNQLERK